MAPSVIREMTVEQLAARLAAGAPTLLLDVRQPWEHDTVALPGSQLIPLDELPDRADELTPSPDTLVVAYCHHGVRSRSAAALLSAAGFPAVVSLAGGIDAWSRHIDPRLRRY